MESQGDTNWWAFSVDPAVRADPGKSRFTGAMDINPPLEGGLRALDYAGYLGLTELLHCQVPSSRIPDERAFIVTHQLMEIIFKLMVFDLAVTGATLDGFARGTAGGNGLPDDAMDEERWRPAMTATARISFACRELLPTVMRVLSDPNDADQTFDSIEFHRFRENLEPASGFQSAQFRLIQRALGKGNLLSVRLFPTKTYHRYYGGDGADPVARVTDPVILHDAARIASPETDDAWYAVARLEESVNAALERLAPDGDRGAANPPEFIEDTDIDRAVSLLERIMSSGAGGPRQTPAVNPGALLRADLREAAARENERRTRMTRARAGALVLRRRYAGSPLQRALDRIVAADEALHGAGQDSFLSVHLRVTRERFRHIRAYAARSGEPEPSIGTGGGGIAYLGWSQRHLIPLFPALVAYRELGD